MRDESRSRATKRLFARPTLRVAVVLAACCSALTSCDHKGPLIIETCAQPVHIVPNPVPVLRVGQNVTLNASVACQGEQFRWSSTAPDVVTMIPSVGESTVVTAVAKGIAVIRVRLQSDSTNSTSVAVMVTDQNAIPLQGLAK